MKIIFAYPYSLSFYSDVLQGFYSVGYINKIASMCKNAKNSFFVDSKRDLTGIF